MMDDCIFCKIVKGELPCFKIYENDRVLAFMDINPVAEGHCLVIPKNHYENLHVIAPDDLSAVHHASIKIAGGLREVLQPSGIACLQLNGKGVNQMVMHYHLHLIPNTADAPPLKMTAWEMIAGDMDAIGELGTKLATALAGN